MAAEVKTIGSSGQISLGKENAGRAVIVEEIDKGVWLIKSARVVPESEMWLQDPQVGGALSRAVDWAAEHPPEASNPDALERRIRRKK